MSQLKDNAEDARRINADPSEVAFQTLMKTYATSGSPQDDQPPPRPEGVHEHSEPLPTYSKMMATLLDQVNQALAEKKPADRYGGMLAEIGEHLAKVQQLQRDLIEKLAELEKEEKKKITSETYRTGFDSSQVSKEAGGVSTASASSGPELLNPAFKEKLSKGDDVDPNGGSQSPSSTKTDDTEDDAEIEASPKAKEFGAIKADEYRTSAEFLAKHPRILTERETDGLLVLAFDAALQGRDNECRNLVHQALLLQYSRALGRDGVALFFKRITTKGHQARDVFAKDVQATHGRIISRAREILAERSSNNSSGDGGEVEQIQLQAVEPGTVIQIRVPAQIEDDAHIEGIEAIGAANDEERETARKELIQKAQAARRIFDGFSEEMRAALETGKLDEVNRVLGAMPLADAEAMVELFSEVSFVCQSFYLQRCRVALDRWKERRQKRKK